MAIDTEAKRRSAMPIHGILTVQQIPDGANSEADRVQSRWIYNGIALQPNALTPTRKWFGEDFYRTRYK